ncbi:hypothetical protein KCP78_24475 [Salmonella enterica subsp. enterica]|nr:hypothetical protein KCP78_24475 [Salmonella enterica subsp. enterica]
MANHSRKGGKRFCDGRRPAWRGPAIDFRSPLGIRQIRDSGFEHQVGDTDMAARHTSVLPPPGGNRQTARGAARGAEASKDILFAADAASHADHQTRALSGSALLLQARTGCGAGHGSGQTCHCGIASAAAVTGCRRFAAGRGKRGGGGYIAVRRRPRVILTRACRATSAGIVGNRSRRRPATTPPPACPDVFGSSTAPPPRYADEWSQPSQQRGQPIMRSSVVCR